MTSRLRHDVEEEKSKRALNVQNDGKRIPTKHGGFARFEQ
jgi:hypothetical protein